MNTTAYRQHSLIQVQLSIHGRSQLDTAKLENDAAAVTEWGCAAAAEANLAQGVRDNAQAAAAAQQAAAIVQAPCTLR